MNFLLFLIIWSFGYWDGVHTERELEKLFKEEKKMQEKINYISQEVIHSNKKNKDYYVIYYLLNRKPVTAFISKEVYDKINIKKLEYMKEYTAIFETHIVGSNIQATLFDIK